MGLIKTMQRAASSVRCPVEVRNDSGQWERRGTRVGHASIQIDPNSLGSEFFSVVEMDDGSFSVVKPEDIREVV